jgi:hypothetical protein
MKIRIEIEVGGDETPLKLAERITELVQNAFRDVGVMAGTDPYSLKLRKRIVRLVGFEE